VPLDSARPLGPRWPTSSRCQWYGLRGGEAGPGARGAGTWRRSGSPRAWPAPRRGLQSP